MINLSGFEPSALSQIEVLDQKDKGPSGYAYVSVARCIYVDSSSRNQVVVAAPFGPSRYNQHKGPIPSSS